MVGKEAMKRKQIVGMLVAAGALFGVSYAAETLGKEVKETSKKSVPESVVPPRSNGVYSFFEAVRAGDRDTFKRRLDEALGVNNDEEKEEATAVSNNPTKGKSRRKVNHTPRRGVVLPCLNMKNEMGETLLHLAAAADNSYMVRVLLSYGADPLAEDKKGCTPEQLAHGDAVKRLFQKARAKREAELAFLSAIRDKNKEAVEGAINNGVNIQALSEDKTQNTLSTALRAHWPEGVKMLLRAGADPNAVRNDGKTMLHVAAAESDPASILLLLKAGANPMTKIGNGATALHDAVWFGRADNVKVLLPIYKSINFSPAADGPGFPVQIAIHRGQTAILRLFLEAGMDVNDPRFKDDPLLVQAVRTGHADMVLTLLRAGVNRYATDKDGKTAFDYANNEMAELLSSPSK